MTGLRRVLPPGVSARQAEPLSRHTALRTGGPCAWFLTVHRAEALADTFAALKAHQLSWSVLGAGTRAIFRDGQLATAVVRLGTGLGRIDKEGPTWTVGGAVPCAALAWAAAGQGRGGLEGLARKPGSLGAALSRDDGPWWSCVREVAVFHRGRIQWREPEQARGHKLVLGARVEPGHVEGEIAARRTVAALRGARSLPSWYAPLKRGTAGVELERVGVPGARLRGAVIPAAAPEMLVNVGPGPARDLHMLHTSAVKRVKQLRGVDLASAVSWVGRAG